MKFSREWAMPSADTFSVPPIRNFVQRHLEGKKVIVDPFARNSRFGTLRNDLNPETQAEWHMDAREFCEMLLKKGVRADAVIFDPPYSINQIKTTYEGVGREFTGEDCWNGRLYSAVRGGLCNLLKPNGIALSFGWNSATFGDFDIIELLLVPHGGAHNDTICVASKKTGQKSIFD